MAPPADKCSKQTTYCVACLLRPSGDGPTSQKHWQLCRLRTRIMWTWASILLSFFPEREPCLEISHSKADLLGAHLVKVWASYVQAPIFPNPFTAGGPSTCISTFQKAFACVKVTLSHDNYTYQCRPPARNEIQTSVLLKWYNTTEARQNRGSQCVHQTSILDAT